LCSLNQTERLIPSATSQCIFPAPAPCLNFNMLQSNQLILPGALFVPIPGTEGVPEGGGNAPIAPAGLI